MNKLNVIRFLLLLFAVFAAATVSGCRYAVTDYKIDLEVNVSASENAVSVGRTNQVPRDASHESPFPSVAYSDAFIHADFSLSDSISVLRIRNKSTDSIVVHWNRAQVRTSDGLRSVGLFGFNRALDGKLLDSPGPPRSGLVPAQSIMAKAEGTLQLRIDASRIFESGLLFGVRANDQGLELASSGIGNWMEWTVPIEIGNEVITYTFRFTVSDVHRRWSYA